MAIQAVHISELPNLDQVPDAALYAPRLPKSVELTSAPFFKDQKFLVIGHRGNGMNALHSSDLRMKAVKENTILSFNTAGKYPVDFIEFDVQVTKDGCPIIFHDNFIYTEHNGEICEKRVTDLALSEFLSYGPQREEGVEGKALFRKLKDGGIKTWCVETDDSACTLQEAFEKVNPSLGFNIELKFDDYLEYQLEHLTQLLQSILRVVSDYANERPIIFSTFHPDAALLVKKLQSTYPVFFLTTGGCETYLDVRRNSLEEAMKVCIEGGLQGIVSEVLGILRNPAAVNKIKELKLSLLTYGKLNNVSELVYVQHLMGVDGVIVDLVKEITEVVSELVPIPGEEEEEENVVQGRLQFPEKERSFLFKLIPQLLQQ